MITLVLLRLYCCLLSVLKMLDISFGILLIMFLMSAGLMGLDSTVDVSIRTSGVGCVRP